MKITIARHSGACYGVKRAVKLAEAAAEEGIAVCTLGQLIHNPGVVSDLEARGVSVAETPEQVSGGRVVIRSHGVTPAVHRALEEAADEVIDATCPHVARAQKAAAMLASQGGTVIVVGEEGHPEVEGLRSYALGQAADVVVVSCAYELPATLNPPIGVVVQTTQKQAVLDEIVSELKSRDFSPDVKNTICSATQMRQEEAVSLAQNVDAMIVIGGRNSSNTTRLAELCSDCGTQTFHIEGVDEIDPRWFKGCDSIGVTAGASTPQVQIDEVVHVLEQLGSDSQTD